MTGRRVALKEAGNSIMEPTDWAPEHSGALRDLLAQRLSFSEAAAVINKRFNTAYSRNAVIGRARRLGLAGADRPGGSPYLQHRINRLGEVCLVVPPSSRLPWP